MAAEQSSDNTVDLPPALWSASFMQDADAATADAIAARLVPTPFGWLTEPVKLEKFFTSGVPSSYVFLQDDQAVPQTVYKAAAARLADARIVSSAGSHEAMLTNPEELASALLTATA